MQRVPEPVLARVVLLARGVVLSLGNLLLVILDHEGSELADDRG
jgi:hypothetical protein